MSKNIPPRKQTEKALRNRVQEMIALNTLYQAVSIDLSIDRIVKAAIDVVTDTITPDLSLLFLREGNKLLLRAYNAKNPQFLHEETPKHHVGECLCGLAASEGKPIYCKDIRNDPRCTMEECKKAGLISFAALPMFREDEIIGVLGLASGTERDFEKRATFLKTLSSGIGIGLKNALLYEEVRQHSAELDEVNVKLRVEIAERKQVEAELKEKGEQLRTIMDASNDFIWLLDTELKIQYGNHAGPTQSMKDLIGVPIYSLLPVEQQAESRQHLERALKSKTVYRYESCVQMSDDSNPIFFENIAVSLKSDGKVVGLNVNSRDITERKKAEDEMKRRLMKYRLEEGSLYLVKEPVPILSLEAFKDLLKVGYPGLVISRTHDEEFKKVIEGNVEFLWIFERGGEKTTPPDLGEIELKIEGLPLKSAVLIDRLDYLVFKNGFKETLSFVQRLRDLAYLARHIVILSIDPSTFDKRELRLLEKEAAKVMPRHKVRLSEDLLETLRFVYEQNAHGLKPYYLAVGREFGISKPTVGKRIKRLVSTGYLIAVVNGNRKILEITEKGRNLFLD